MATPDLPNSNNNVVCEECWEVFLTAIDLEMHRSSCPRISDDHKTVEDDVKTSPSSGILKKVEIDNTNQSSNDNSEADLTVLKTMPPSDDAVTNQNGELLSVFEQSALVQQSSTNMENNLHEFSISLPSQSILGSYIQQQNQHQHDLTLKTDHLKDQHEEEMKCAQELYQQSPEQELLQQQTTALLSNTILLENGLKSSSATITTSTTTTISTKTDKSTYKRKLLPKSNRPAEFSQLFQCTQCDSVFYNDASYRDHARSHAKVKEFVCEYCGITLTKYEQMTKHLDKEHNSDLSYYCYLCYTPADDKFSLQEHLKYCGKNDGPKNNVNHTSTSSHLLPNLLSGSTMKFTDSLKGLINCPKCGQILGTEEGLNIQDKPVDVQCKYCATIVTLVRQASNLPPQNLPVENKTLDLLSQPSSSLQQEPLLIPPVETPQSSTPPQTTSTPLLLYSQSSDSTLSQTGSSTPVSLPALTTDTATGSATSSLSSVGIPTVAMGSPNHMTLGINTTNGLMVLTVPVVTADKMSADSVSAPVLQLPTGNLIFLGTDVNGGNTLPSLGAASPISNAILQNSLPITSSTNILPTNDILMTATAGINSPSSPELSYGFPTEVAKDTKAKLPRYSCPHCGKAFEAQQSWRRHVQTHTATKKQHTCQLCNKTFSRPGQLREHMNKVHNSQEESNNNNSNEVHMIKIKT